MDLARIFLTARDLFFQEPVAGLYAAVTFVSFIFFAAVISLFFQASRHRSWELEREAPGLGFRYAPVCGKGLSDKVRDFALFSSFDSLRLRNLLTGRKNGRLWKVFDHGPDLTAAFAETGPEPLPRMHLVPRIPGLELFGEMVSLERVNIPGRDKFNSRYLLLGLDREAVIRTFSSEVTAFFEKRKESVGVEIVDDKFIYYRIGRQVTPGELSSFLDEAEMVYQHLAKHWQFALLRI